MKIKKVIKDDFSNIITPPDFVKTKAHTVLLIDPEWSEIEDVAFYLKSSAEIYNVYVYRIEMNDDDWLQKAIKKSEAIIVNTVNNDNSPVKDRLAVKPIAYYYGPKNFLMNNNRIEKPVDYFVLQHQLTQKGK